MINFAKSKCWMFFPTHTLRHTHMHTRTLTKKRLIQKKQVIYSIKWQMYSKTTHQTKCEIEVIGVSELQNNDRTSALPKFVIYKNLITYIAITMGMLRRPEIKRKTIKTQAEKIHC